MLFNEWIKKVANMFYEATGIQIEFSNHEDWRGYFEGGYSPEDAVSEEISYWADNT